MAHVIWKLVELIKHSICLMGRDVMRVYGQPEQSVMSMDILEGLDGKEKMSKSLDNYVGIADEAT
jgi:tyrosyl-tRNA synthetase